jgi:hypothetical protein
VASERDYDRRKMNALRGAYALLRIPLPRLQQEILPGHDRCPTRQRKDQVPEVRRRQSRTAVGRFLRYYFKEELTEERSQVVRQRELSRGRGDNSSRFRSLLNRHGLGVRCGLRALIGIKRGVGASQ